MHLRDAGDGRGGRNTPLVDRAKFVPRPYHRRVDIKITNVVKSWYIGPLSNENEYMKDL